MKRIVLLLHNPDYIFWYLCASLFEHEKYVPMQILNAASVDRMSSLIFAMSDNDPLP